MKRSEKADGSVGRRGSAERAPARDNEGDMIREFQVAAAWTLAPVER